MTDVTSHMFTSVFSGVRVTRSLVLYVCFVYRCLSFCTFSFGHCVVCSSSIYGFVITLWYLQTLLSLDPSFFLIPMKIERKLQIKQCQLSFETRLQITCLKKINYYSVWHILTCTTPTPTNLQYSLYLPNVVFNLRRNTN